MAHFVASHLVADFLPLAFVQLQKAGTELALQILHNLLGDVHLVLLSARLTVNILVGDDDFAENLVSLVLVVGLVLPTQDIARSRSQRCCAAAVLVPHTVGCNSEEDFVHDDIPILVASNL